MTKSRVGSGHGGNRCRELMRAHPTICKIFRRGPSIRVLLRRVFVSVCVWLQFIRRYSAPWTGHQLIVLDTCNYERHESCYCHGPGRTPLALSLQSPPPSNLLQRLTSSWTHLHLPSSSFISPLLSPTPLKTHHATSISLFAVTVSGSFYPLVGRRTAAK